MEDEAPPRGACAYCGRALTRVGMSRHLGSCPERAAHAREESRKSKRAPERLLHLQARDSGWGGYWLDLEMPASATLELLDGYLRAIWLECCGHMSRFTIGKPWSGHEVGMGTRLGRAFDQARELTHVYDFGTSSITSIRLVDEWQGVRPGPIPVALMARNEPPDFRCMECDAPATTLCMDCVYDGLSGMLCQGHAKGHPHDEDLFMPVVNSPRMGLCGYTGPATAP